MGNGQGYINVTKRTANHADTLKKLGYPVSVADGKILVEHQGVVAHLDVTAENFRQVIVDEVIKQKKVFSYKSKVVLDGKELGALPLCGKLGVLSALVMHVEGFKDKGKAKAGQDIDDILKML